MNNKKKIALFLGAVSLIAFGNYKQFVKNSKQKTVVEGKSSEKAFLRQVKRIKKVKAVKKQLYLQEIIQRKRFRIQKLWLK